MSIAARRAGESRVPILFTGAFLLVLLRTAWLSDDSYIIFRTVDNFIHGWGLRWNVAERVQTFTDPLWTLSLAALSWVTREIYFTSLSLSIAVSAAAFLIVARRLAVSRASSALAASVLLLSRAFVDYSTSGLENPLTHLLLALFFLVFLERDLRPKTIWMLSTIAFLGTSNRPDTLLLYLPALLWCVLRDFSLPNLSAAALGALPFVAWEFFALLYYGFPFPNTAYAKLHTGIPSTALAHQGFVYLWQSLRTDPVTLTATAAGLAVPFCFKQGREKYAALGAALYLVYVVRVGGDFMSGRFLTAPFFCSALLLSRIPPPSRKTLSVAAGILAILILCHPSSLPLTGKDYGADRADLIDKNGISDERAFYYPRTGLLRWKREHPLPDDPMAEEGKTAAVRGDPVVVRWATGYFGYFAGPAVHVVDIWALGDALLARLPVVPGPWRIGHFTRNIPDGYLHTLATGRNRIVDASLAAYFDKLFLILKGPLFDPERLSEILRMNLGEYDGMKSDYLRHPSPRRLVLEASEESLPKPAGVPWDDPGNVMMGPPGVEIVLPETSRAPRVEVSLDHNDSYELSFLEGESETGRVEVPAAKFPVSGLRVDTIPTPPESVRAGYDRIRVRPLAGDGWYSLGHLRLLP